MDRRKERELRKTIVDRLNAEKLDDAPDFGVAAQKIVNIFRDCPNSVWWSIDNAIGNAEKIGLDSPHLVRQVRNHPHWGRELFAALGR